MRGPYGDGSRHANPLASLLPGTWCACLIQVQGQQQRVPECTYRAHQSQTPTMSRSWGPGLLQPKVLCNPWCCCQSLHRRCWGTAGSPTPQAEPLPPPVPPDTGAADTPLRRGHTDVSRWGTRLFQRKSLRTLLPEILGGAWNTAIQLRAFYSRRNQSECHGRGAEGSPGGHKPRRHSWCLHTTH